MKSVSSTQLLKKTASVKPGKLDRFILFQVAWCTFPALVLMRFGQLSAGGIWCFMFLLVLLARYALKRNIPAFMALTVAALPALSYTRGFFFYNSIVVLLGVGLALWYIRSPKECSKLWDNRLIRWFFVAGTVYWLISILLTGKYYSNLRTLEMLCSAGSIYLLARHPKYLATALAGLGISIFSVAIGMIGQGDRLGMADIEGEHVGNAITFGLPVALVLLLAIADNGKWLFLQHSKVVKNGLIAMWGVFLLLSTSRGAWLVALVGIAVAVFYQSQNRRKIFMAILLASCMLPIGLQTKSGEKASEYLNKLIDPEIPLSEQTTGRSSMWMLFPKVLEDSPIWGVGPGLGKEAYAYYSWVDRKVTFHQGKDLAWHAMYLQVGVETGLIGMMVITIFFIILILKSLNCRRLTGHVMPLIGIIFFITAGLSVPGFDAITGLALGFAFLGTMPLPKNIANKAHQPGKI